MISKFTNQLTEALEPLEAEDVFVTPFRELLQRAIQHDPEKVLMADTKSWMGHFEANIPISYDPDESDVDVYYDVSPGEPQTHDYPGSDPEVEIMVTFFDGDINRDVTSILSGKLIEEFEEDALQDWRWKDMGQPEHFE